MLANGDESNLILPKFARPLYFFSHQLFGTYRNKLNLGKKKRKQAVSARVEILQKKNTRLIRTCFMHCRFKELFSEYFVNDWEKACQVVKESELTIA